MTQQHRAWALYSRLLAATLEPSTTNQVAAKTGATQNVARILLRRMLRGGIVHVAGWTAPMPKYQPMPIYAFGPGESAPRPLAKKTGKPAVRGAQIYPAPRPILQLTSYMAIVRMLLSAPATIEDVVEMTGTSKGSVRRLMHDMRSLGIAHVAGHRRRDALGGTPPQLWAVAVNQPDAPRLERLDRHQSAKRRREAAAYQREMQRYIRGLASNASVFALAQNL